MQKRVFNQKTNRDKARIDMQTCTDQQAWLNKTEDEARETQTAMEADVMRAQTLDDVVHQLSKALKEIKPRIAEIDAGMKEL